MNHLSRLHKPTAVMTGTIPWILLFHTGVISLPGSGSNGIPAFDLLKLEFLSGIKFRDSDLYSRHYYMFKNIDSAI